MRKDSEDIFSQRKIDLIHSAYVVHTLYQQQKLGKYCDLKVLVGDKQYFVHRCILAAASAQLDSQINGLDTIQLVGVTYYGFECLLEILYSGKLHDISSLSDSRFQQIVSAADALNAETVMEYCTRERGDLMALLLHQNNAIQNEQDNQKAVNNVSDANAVDSNSNTIDQANDPTTIKELTGRNAMDEQQNLAIKSEPRTTRNENEVEYAEAPVAAEVEVGGVKQEESGVLVERGENKFDNTLHTTASHYPPAAPPTLEVEALQDGDAEDDCENETGMTCYICRAVFLNTSDRKLHMHTHIGENLLKCNICGLHFKSESALTNHKKVHCTCQYCGQEFKSMKDLQVHHEHFHRDQSFTTTLQNDGLSAASTSSRLAKRKSGVTPSMTRNKSAGKPAINPVIVNEIMRGEDGKYQCPLCDRGFDRRWNLKCHVLIHTAPKDKDRKQVTESRYAEAVFTCPECGKLFRNLHNLRRHASSMHGMNATDLEEASENNVGDYHAAPTPKRPRKEHLDQSADDYKFWCPICGRGFKRNRNLRGHMESHQSEGVAKYECPVCHRKFAQKESLNGHLWVHKSKHEEPKDDYQ